MAQQSGNGGGNQRIDRQQIVETQSDGMFSGRYQWPQFAPSVSQFRTLVITWARLSPVARSASPSGWRLISPATNTLNSGDTILHKAKNKVNCKNVLFPENNRRRRIGGLLRGFYFRVPYLFDKTALLKPQAIPKTQIGQRQVSEYQKGVDPLEWVMQ